MQTRTKTVERIFSYFVIGVSFWALLTVWAVASTATQNQLPSVLTSENATSILNDIALLSGVLIGFVSIIAADNIKVIETRRDSGLRLTDCIDKICVLAIDIAVILAFVSVIGKCMISLANVTNDVSSSDIGYLISLVYFGLALIIYRIGLNAFYRPS